MDRSAVALTVSEPVPALGSFEAFYDRERGGLYGTLCLITGSPAEADDLAQEAFVRVWERWDRVAGMEHPAAYLYRVAVNLQRSWYRRALRSAGRGLARGDDAEPFAELEARDEVFRALAGLAPRQRAAVVLTDLLGFDSEAAGRMLSVRPSTVRVLAHQGRASMKQSLEANDG